MCDLSPNGNWETDNATDFSHVNRRLESFQGSSLAQQVPAERLAQAGFFFTGPADRVCCFSCNATVENWRRGDKPVERHKEASPSCTFLKCVHRTSFKPNSSTLLSNGSIYNEVAGDMEYRLGTGEVVDESIYPKIPHMRREEARLQTFSSWSHTAPVKPVDLAQAGLFYLGQSDCVQCFCCGGKLSGWETGDTPWGEHSRHFPGCFFILGHDVDNVPIQRDTEKEESGSSQNANAHVHMASFEGRLASFAGVLHPVDHEQLARAGFYSTRSGDSVLCFRCDGGLKDWQPEEDPWEEHARHYPGCSFLLAEKGKEFVNSIQLQRPQHNRATPSHQNGFVGDMNETLSSPVAQKVLEMGLEPSIVEKTILEKIRRTGTGYSNIEVLIADCLRDSEESDPTNSGSQGEDPLEKLRKLQMEKQCKICMDRDLCVLFLPCRHLVTCERCSQSVSNCPICCGAITQRIKAYIA